MKNNSEQISLSINKKRWLKFKSMKRGYYSLILITILYGLSWILPILVNNKAIIVSYNNQLYFPAFHDFSLIENRVYLGNEFGQDKVGQADYLNLKKFYQSFNLISIMSNV